MAEKSVSIEDLTTTSYAILGMLAIQSWTTYELAKQMDRSLRRYWPRAASRIYAEPKRLEKLGLASAARGHVGRRPRTVYSITDSGRQALAAWLARPGAGPVLECEAVLKVFFAEQATTQDVLINISALRSWAEHEVAENVAFARLYAKSEGPFPERAAAIALTGRFRTDFADMVANWAEWAEAVVREWPDDPTRARPDWETLRSIAARSITPVELPPE